MRIAVCINTGYPIALSNERASTPAGVQTPFTPTKPEKPVTVMDRDEEGEKIPRLYKTAATMTMTSMAQP